MKVQSLSTLSLIGLNLHRNSRFVFVFRGPFRLKSFNITFTRHLASNCNGTISPFLFYFILPSLEWCGRYSTDVQNRLSENIVVFVCELN